MNDKKLKNLAVDCGAMPSEKAIGIELLTFTTEDLRKFVEQWREKHFEELTLWVESGEKLLAKKNTGSIFRLGGWWADRPWRNK